MTTELQTEGGMHIAPDPKTGAIAASQVNEDTVKTQEGIAAKDDQPEQTPAAEAAEPDAPVNPRDAIMKTIYEGRAKQFKNELEYAAQASAGATNLPASEEPAQQPDPAIADEQPVVKVSVVDPEKPAEQQVNVQSQQQAQQPLRKNYVIAGQNVQLTDDELATLTNRAIAQQQLIYGQQQAQQQQPQQRQQVQQPVQNTDRLRETVRKITYGSEDEAVKALADFADHTAQTVRQTSGPSPEQIANFAAQQALSQVQFQTNLDTIAREFPDVFEKRSATLVAADYVNSLRNRNAMLGTAKPDIELYREACQLTRTEFGNQSQEQQQPHTGVRPTVVQVSSTKIERKRTTPQPPASVSRVLPAQQERSASGSDIVNAMRKSRGQSAIT